MLCSRCGVNPAKQYTIRTADGERTEWLCSACYQRRKKDAHGFPTAFPGKAGGAGGQSCPVCGTTLDDFRKTGLLGCAHCYAAFRKELLPSIRKLQGKLQHEGKTPDAQSEERYARKRELVDEQERLKTAFERAVREKDYSAAESIKERLFEVNHKLYRGEKQ